MSQPLNHSLSSSDTMSTVVARMGRKSSTPRRSDSVAVTSSISPTAPRNPAARSTRSTGQATHFKPLEGAPPVQRTRRPSAKAAAAQQVVTMSPTATKSHTTVTPKKRSASSSAATNKTTARPAKRARASPTPEPEDEEAPDRQSSDDDNDGDDSEHEQEGTGANSPPARKRAQRTAHLPLPSPAATPPKRILVASPSKFAPKVPSPLKPKQRRTAPISSDDDRPDGDLTATALYNLENVFSSTPASSSTPTTATTPRKSVTSTPRTTPSRSSSISKATPGSSSRSSSRIQHLPPAVVDIKNAPASLRSRLVGFHMEDEGYGVCKAASPTRGNDSASETGSDAGASDDDVEEQLMAQRRRDAKGKGRMMMVENEHLDGADSPAMRDSFALLDGHDDEDAEMDLSLPIPPPPFSADLALDEEDDDADVSQSTPRASTSAATASPAKRHPLLPSVPDKSYLASPLRKHILSSLAVLSGARFPLPATLPEASTCDSIMGLPCMTGGYDGWERPLRSALDECVKKGMGNAVMLLGPRGIGKTMVSHGSFACCVLGAHFGLFSLAARRTLTQASLARSWLGCLCHCALVGSRPHDGPLGDAKHRGPARGARFRFKRRQRRRGRRW